MDKLKSIVIYTKLFPPQGLTPIILFTFPCSFQELLWLRETTKIRNTLYKLVYLVWISTMIFRKSYFRNSVVTVSLYLENLIDSFLIFWEITYFKKKKKIYQLKEISNCVHANSLLRSECMLSILNTSSTTSHQFIHFSMHRSCDISVNVVGHPQISFGIDIIHNINTIWAKPKVWAQKCEKQIVLGIF